ncbi:MAG: hypothetical protein EXR72_15745 [Myxococcales bacterium]|nr:hypothetical protein [Myxococcales bacterium]
MNSALRIGSIVFATLGLALAGCGTAVSTTDGPASTGDMAKASGDMAVAGGDMAMMAGGDMAMMAGGDMAGAPDMAKGSGATVTVMVGAGGLNFDPADAKIKVGDTVHWVWAGAGHNVVSGDKGADNKFCSPNGMNCAAAPTSNAGTTYDFKFTMAGSYPYFCAPHAGAGMKGTVTVQ